MKFALGVTAFMLVIMVSAIESSEIPRPSTLEEPIPAPYIVPERANRQRRVTCDLLSFDSKWGSINHAACAAHCLAMMKGFRGGYCNDKGVCVCRK